MATKIQLRRDTAADWTSTNPTLAAGEFGWESDTNKFKIGDGATAWTSLAYASDGDTAGITFVGDDSTGTLVSQNETFKVAGTQNVTTAVSGDTLTVTGPDLSSYATGSSTTTFTNKTFDANGTGNSISNIETADIAAATLVTAADTIASNNNDTTIPTSAAVKAYADSVGGGGGASLGDLTATGSTLTAPSNGTLALETSGTGKVVLAANNGNYESGLSSTRYNNSNNLFYEDTSETLATGTQRYLNTIYGRVTLTSGQGTSTNSNDRWMNQNLVRLDMNGNSSTNSSSTYRSRGPSALKNYTTVVNGGAGASTLGNATANLNGIYSYLNNQDLTITAATGVNSTLEFESDGTGDLNVTEWRAYQSFADQYGSSGSLNITDFYHYYCDTPSGNITNQYAFYDATNSLSVFGDIQTQAVSITDNLITTNRSNDNLDIEANGTGRINIGSPLEDSALWSEWNGNASRIHGGALVYEDLAVNPGTLADREYGHAIFQGSRLTASSSGSNFRPRAAMINSAVDLDGFSYTNTSKFAGPLGAQITGSVTNSSATNATINTVRGVESSAAVVEFNGAAGDINVVDAMANYGANFFERDGSGDLNVTNAYGFYTDAYGDAAGSGTVNLTNQYGYYYAGASGFSTLTNQYAFYDATNSLSVFGDIQTQAVSITDNLITTNRSNDDLTLGTNGTGRIKLSTDGSDFFNNPLYEAYFGGTGNIKTLGISSDETVNAQTAARNYQVGISQNTTLSASGTSNSNFRQRTMNLANSMDMAGFSFTQASDGRGPMAGNFATNVVNSDTTASTLYTASGLNVAMSAYDEGSFSDGDVTVTEAIGTQSFIELYSGGTGSGNFTFTNAYNYKTKASIGANDTITNLYGYYYRAPGGSGTITNQYAFYDASNSLSVFGDIQTQAVSITDNLITTNRSNDSLGIGSNGTGQINLSTTGQFSSSDMLLLKTGYGTNSVNNLKGVGLYYKADDIAEITTDSDRQYAHALASEFKLATGINTSNSNMRFRNYIASASMDMNGSSSTSTSLSRGPRSGDFQTLVINSAAGASTLGSAVAGTGGIYLPNGSYGDLTITNAVAVNAFSELATDTGQATTITNLYGFRTGSDMSGSGTGTVTNDYGFYVSTLVGTNKYAFYDASNSLSRFGAVILANQAGDPSGVTDSAHIYAKDDAGSSEVYVRDEAGNVTKISPHNEAGEWEYYSRNSKTGKTVRINMEKLVAEVEKLSGKSFIESE